MNPKYHEAAKRVLADEFGIDGVDDPEVVRLLLVSKFEAMNALERAALQMKLGRALQEGASGVKPSLATLAAVDAVFVVLAWFLWRPLTGVLVIFSLANVRQFTIRHALLWAPSGAIIIGTLYGCALGGVVAASVALTVHGVAGTGFLIILGFFGAGYIGYGVEKDPLFRMPGDEKRVAAAGAAVVAYLLCVIVYIGARALL